MVQVDVTTDTNYSALTVNPYDSIDVSRGATLTINTSTVDSIFRLVNITSGHIQIENDSTTTPIFVWLGAPLAGQPGNQRYIRVENSGTLTVDGGLIELGTGSGVAGQTFNLPQDATSTNCPNLGGLWVEGNETLRDGTAVMTNYLQVADAEYNTALDNAPFNRIFKQDTTANTVTFKTAIPSGQKVYMGNVIIREGTNNKQNDTWFDFKPGAVVRMQNLHSQGLRASVTPAYSLFVRNMALADCWSPFYLQGTSTPVDIQSVIVHTDNSQAFYAQQEDRAGRISNLWLNGTGSSDCVVINANGLDLEKAIVTSYGHSSPGNRNGLNFQQIRNGQIRDVDIAHAGTGLLFVADRTFVDGVTFVCGTTTAHTGAQYNRNAMYLGSCNLLEIRNVTVPDPAVTQAAYLSQAMINGGVNLDRVLLEDFVLYSGVSGNDRTQRFTQNIGGRVALNNFALYGDCGNNVFYGGQEGPDVRVSNYRTPDQTTNASITVAPSTSVDQVSSGSSSDYVNLLNSSVLMRSHLVYRHDDTDRTKGRVHSVMCAPGLIDDPEYYQAVTQTGTIDVSNGFSGLRINNLNDAVEFTSRVHPNVVGIGPTVGQYTNTSYFAIRLAVRRPDDTWSAYEDMTTANVTALNALVTALPPHPSDSVQFKWEVKYVRTQDPTDGLQHALTQCWMDVILSGALFPFERPEWMDESPWDAPLANHTTPDTFGELVQQIKIAATSAASSRTN